MFTSDEQRKPYYEKLAFAYLIIAVFCAFAGAVYEHFSHGVYANAMIYAFAFPLLLGALPLYALLHKGGMLPGRAAMNLYNAGVATLCTGSFFCGALEIYGTTNDITLVYWIAGGALCVAGAAWYCIELAQRKKAQRKA